MPFTNVMPQFKQGTLRTGSKTGPLVKNRKQAIAIMLAEKKKAQGGDTEYQSPSNPIGPSPTAKTRMFGRMKGIKNYG